MVRLFEKITWWAAQSGAEGDVFASPKFLDGRWEDKSVDFKGAGGRDLTSQAIVYLSSQVSVGDYLCKGEILEAIPPTGDAYPVMAFQQIPDLRTLRSLNRALL